MSRTQDQILARIAAVKDDDWLGFRSGVLVHALDYDHAKPFLNDDVTRDEWERTRSDPATEARDYLPFAISKILSHRGISAHRSVDKLREWAWLLSRDDVVSAMDSARYEQYGAPIVKAFADGMGWPWPTGNKALDRMVAGMSCWDDCADGCDQ